MIGLPSGGAVACERAPGLPSANDRARGRMNADSLKPGLPPEAPIKMRWQKGPFGDRNMNRAGAYRRPGVLTMILQILFIAALLALWLFVLPRLGVRT